MAIILVLPSTMLSETQLRAGLVLFLLGGFIGGIASAPIGPETSIDSPQIAPQELPDLDTEATTTPTQTTTPAKTAKPGNTTPERNVSHQSGPSLAVKPFSESSSSFNLSLASVNVLTQQSVVPGDAGSGGATLENTGTENGIVEIRGLSYTEAENGRTEPEAIVDASPNTGELAAAVEVAIALELPDGTRTYVVGSPTTKVPLESVNNASLNRSIELEPDEELTIDVEWSVPTSVGDEIQSDSVTVDMDVQMTQN